MTLKPTDMLEIQSAIDDYERRFPRRATPSAQAALSWRIGKRAAARVFERAGKINPQAEIDDQECGRLAWAFEKLRMRLDNWSPTEDDSFESLEESVPWLRSVLVVCGWSAGAVVAVSLFFVGALVGGFK
jgi:hypothetical protein